MRVLFTFITVVTAVCYRLPHHFAHARLILAFAVRLRSGYVLFTVVSRMIVGLHCAAVDFVAVTPVPFARCCSDCAVDFAFAVTFVAFDFYTLLRFCYTVTVITLFSLFDYVRFHAPVDYVTV